jgi:hypothetical protein
MISGVHPVGEKPLAAVLVEFKAHLVPDDTRKLLRLQYGEYLLVVGDEFCEVLGELIGRGDEFECVGNVGFTVLLLEVFVAVVDERGDEERS